MSEPYPDGPHHGTTNDCASKNKSDQHCDVDLESISTPMPPVQNVLDDIQITFGHMPPLPPSDLALKLKVLRQRQDNIYGDTVDFDSNSISNMADNSNQDIPISNKESANQSRFADSNDEPDFSNQECTTNSRFAHRPRIGVILLLNQKFLWK